jgi:hypothetical protein
MTSEEYRSLAADFRMRAKNQECRMRAKNQECPAFRAELEDLARCYEWAATATGARHLSDGVVRKVDCVLSSG